MTVTPSWSIGELLTCYAIIPTRRHEAVAEHADMGRCRSWPTLERAGSAMPPGPLVAEEPRLPPGSGGGGVAAAAAQGAAWRPLVGDDELAEVRSKCGGCAFFASRVTVPNASRIRPSAIALRISGLAIGHRLHSTTRREEEIRRRWLNYFIVRADITDEHAANAHTGGGTRTPSSPELHDNTIEMACRIRIGRLDHSQVTAAPPSSPELHDNVGRALCDQLARYVVYSRSCPSGGHFLVLRG